MPKGYTVNAVKGLSKTLLGLIFLTLVMWLGVWFKHHPENSMNHKLKFYQPLLREAEVKLPFIPPHARGLETKPLKFEFYTLLAHPEQDVMIVPPTLPEDAPIPLSAPRRLATRVARV